MSKLVTLIGLLGAVVCLVNGAVKRDANGYVYLEGIPFTRPGWAEHLGRSLDFAEMLGRHFYNNMVYPRYFHNQIVRHIRTPGLTQIQRDRLELAAAALNEDLEGVKKFAPRVMGDKKGLNFHIYDGGMCSILDMAVYRGDENLPVIKYLVENGADIELDNLYGENALYVATVMGHTKVVRYLLERGANPNEKNREGVTVAMAAAYLGKPEILRVLFERGASIKEIISDNQFVELLILKPRSDCQVAQKVWDLLNEFGNGWRLAAKQLAIWKEMNECSKRRR